MNGSSGAKRLNSPTLSSDSVANSRNTLSTFKKYGRDLSILNETVVSRADVLVEPHDMGDMRVQNSERLRGIAGTVEFSGNAHFAVMGPTMAFANVEMFIDWRNSFQTNSPALGCSGKLFLLPVKSEGNGPVLRKIWVLSTWIETLSEQTEDETVLSSPNKSLVANTVNNDAFMAGAGSFGLEVAARLKALGVDSIVVDRNEHIGDNWTRRPGYRNARNLAEQEVECVIPDFHYGTSA
ncbi:flavin-containing monooxygenase [Seiridium cupressi]